MSGHTENGILSYMEKLDTAITELLSAAKIPDTPDAAETWAQRTLDGATGDDIPYTFTVALREHLTELMNTRFGTESDLRYTWGEGRSIIDEFIDVYSDRYGAYTEEPDYDWPGLFVAYQHALYATGRGGTDKHLCRNTDHTALTINRVGIELVAAVKKAMLPGWGIEQIREDWEALYDVYQRTTEWLSATQP